MKFSIIVPVFNAGNFLSDAIQSIHDNHTAGHDFEILLVDDKSTDETTLTLLSEFGKDPKIRVLRQCENGGPAKARNAGLQAATGTWVGFLDADDMMAPGAMALRLDMIERAPQARWILADVLEIRRKHELSHENHFAAIHQQGKEISPGIFCLVRPTSEMLTWGILPVLGAMMIRRDVFSETGLLDEKLTYGEDINFCLVLSRSADLYWTPKPCLHLRRYHDSMTKDIFRGACAMPKASLQLLRDKRFRGFKKELRWQHAANLRALSKAYMHRGNRFSSFVSALSALCWVPNDMRNISVVLQSIFYKNV